MSTVLNLIEDSLELIGVIDTMEAIDAAKAQRCLRRLNAMLSSWSADGLMVFTTNILTFPLIIGQQDYTLGTLGDFNTDRPVWLDKASIIPTASAPNLEIPIAIDSDDDWQDVSIKSIQSTFPLEVHPKGDFPLNTLQFWPIPTAACSVVLYLPQQLGSFVNVNQTANFPPGYEEAIVYNLASRIAPIFGAQTPPDVMKIAVTSKQTIEAQNIPITVLAVESAMCGNMTGPSISAIKSKGYVVD